MIPISELFLRRRQNIIPQAKLEQVREEANFEKLARLKEAFRDVLEDIVQSTKGAAARITIRKPPREMFGKNWIHWATLPDISKGTVVVRGDSAIFTVTDETEHSATFSLSGDEFAFQERTLVRPFSRYKDKVEKDISRLEFGLALLGYKFVDEP